MANKACSSSTKVRKGHQEAANSLCTVGGEGEDRISDLPDELLGYILSRFPTKVAVQTSVLSKRWMYVWTSVPCISIEDDLILPTNKTRFRNPKFKACFADFVRRVLHLNKVSSLKKFKLVCTRKYRQCFIEHWVSALTTRRRNVEDLYLQNLEGFEQKPRIELPPCLFTFNKLTSLKLHDLFVLKVPISSVSLTSLKILHLVLLQYYDDVSLNNLLAGCPVLEEFDMKRARDDNVKTLYIQSSSLKSFRLNNEMVLGEDSNLDIVVDAKNLERLDLGYCGTENFIVSSLSSVVFVRLDLDPDYFDGDVFIELLSKTCNTKYMQLCHSSMECLERTTLDNLPMSFNNLTHLVVRITASSWLQLSYLIECSPNLITFDLSLVGYGFETDGLDEVGFCTPKCLMLYLESITIERFTGSKNEMEMASYFIKNSTVLKKMAIYVESVGEFFSDAKSVTLCCKELIMLSKASTVCEITIDSHDLSFKKWLALPWSHQEICLWKERLLIEKSRKGVKSSN